jgi:hemerythrin-like metal-binding protein
MDDKYKLGIEIIDNQHKKIFDLIDKLCVIENNEKKIVKSIINELKEYSEYHFKTEEDYFKSLNFSESEKHIHLHDIFIQTIEYYYEFPEKLNKKKLYTFLNTWIKNHILIEDKKYITKEYIK